MRVVTPEEFPIPWVRLRPFQKRGRGNPKTKNKTEYVDVISAFDIETTRIKEIEQSVMYVWQWAFGTVETGCEYVVIGRTWEQFEKFKRDILVHLKPEQKMVCFVHNLSYEFCWLRGLWRFEPEDVFAVKPRKILRANMGNLEFRCSYLHSNMSLKTYLKKMQVEHQKQSGAEFDYSKQRFPWTPLEDKEIPYIVNDVAGLVEAIGAEMAHDGDNLYTFPLTSTGYVRRDAKQAMRQVARGFVSGQLPTLDVIELAREAFRGGNCHANRYFTNRTIRALREKLPDGTEAYNIHAADRSSSYPDIVCNCKFPVSSFQPHPFHELEDVLDLIERRGRAVLMRCKIWGVELQREEWGCPYLSRDKCRSIREAEYDNGRILQAEYLETSITDLDLKIIAKEYTWKHIEFTDVYSARYGYLPRPLVELTIKYYRLKTELKNVKGQEVLYTKSKNKLNSIYGMMAQWVLKELLVYLQDADGETGQLFEEQGKYNAHLLKEELGVDELTDEQLADIHAELRGEALEKYYKRAFLLYQWGVWVTAWARYRLEEGIELAHGAGADFLYCDTDSVYYIGFIDWDRYNKARIADSKRSGAYATDPRGETHYMGVYERDHDLYEFRTMGAKKYVKCEAPDSPLIATISGVVKEDENGNAVGGKELEEAGGIDAFCDGFTFVKAGGLEAVYNDRPFGDYEIDGHTLYIGPNVVLRESTYTLGRTADYIRLLEAINTKISIDNQQLEV